MLYHFSKCRVRTGLQCKCNLAAKLSELETKRKDNLVDFPSYHRLHPKVSFGPMPTDTRSSRWPLQGRSCSSDSSQRTSMFLSDLGFQGALAWTCEAVEPKHIPLIGRIKCRSTSVREVLSYSLCLVAASISQVWDGVRFFQWLLRKSVVHAWATHVQDREVRLHVHNCCSH